MTDALISAGIQISFTLVLALISYIVLCRKKNCFFNWIGLYLPQNRNWIKSSIVVFVVSFFVVVGRLTLFQYLGNITNEMFYDKTLNGQGIGISTVIIILLKAIIKQLYLKRYFFEVL